MSRHYRLVFLLLSSLILIIVSYFSTGSFAFVTSDFWFYAGLLMLILLSVVDQPHFSKDANIFINGLTGFIALLTVAHPDRDFIWKLFFFWSIYLVISSYGLMWVRSKELPFEHWATALLSRLNREIGKPEALFSAFFLWAVFTQVGTQSSAYRPLFIYWAIFILLNIPTVSRAIAERLERPNDTSEALGVITNFHSPRVFECRLDHSSPSLPSGTTVAIHAPNGEEAAHAVVTEDRVLSGSRFCRLSASRLSEGWSQLGASASGNPVVRLLPLPDIGARPIGIVEPGTDIVTLRVSINPGTSLEEGEVLRVPIGDRDAYYQVVGARIAESTIEGQWLQSVAVAATQLGIWDAAQCFFEPITWVASPGELVFTVKVEEERPAHEIPAGRLQLGHVPNSAFPIHVEVEDLVTHNSAIIGVTGSGKSYLAFRIIEMLMQSNIKILVLDMSRQHWVFLQSLNPFPIRNAQEITAWMASDQKVGIHQFADATSYPTRTADLIAAAFGQLENSVTLRPGYNERARMCVVLEEAHSLVPEWNQVADRGDVNEVNRAARLILQGRKYGMGCLLITQRTANVTKTILNQCNTIFALRSFDQTGLDFLRNYMGEAYAQAISTMPSRHAILVGKASSSMRPVLFKIEDYTGRWQSADGASSEDSET